MQILVETNTDKHAPEVLALMKSMANLAGDKVDEKVHDCIENYKRVKLNVACFTTKKQINDNSNNDAEQQGERVDANMN